MAIKRLTIELDDAVDSTTSTMVPSSSGEKQKEPTQDAPDGTKIPDSTKEEAAVSPKEKSVAQPTTGRTFPDLVHDSANDYRVMATLLMALPFPFFAAKIDSVAAFKYPVLTGCVLNAVWFGITLASAAIRSIRSMKKH